MFDRATGDGIANGVGGTLFEVDTGDGIANGVGGGGLSLNEIVIQAPPTLPRGTPESKYV